jgi:Spy/CpxP family protein refolding chaperone
MSQQDRRAKMMSIRQTTESQIRSVLDANQQKKFDQMMARRAEHMHNHEGNGAPDQAPPQQ